MRTRVPLFGGWTPTYPGDLCKGGHPPQSIFRDQCNRCGRRVDNSRCFCGAEGHEMLSRSFCPKRKIQDQRDAEDHSYLFSALGMDVL